MVTLILIRRVGRHRLPICSHCLLKDNFYLIWPIIVMILLGLRIRRTIGLR